MTIDSMKDYLAAIGRYPLLTADQEIQLSRQVRRMIELQAMEGERSKPEQREIKRGMRARDTIMNCNLRLVVHIAKHCGAGVIAFVHALGPAQAAAQKLRAFVDADLYVALYRLPLAFAGQGAIAFAVVRTVDHLHLGTRLCRVLQSLRIHTALDQKARRRIAALAGVAHAFVDAKAYCFVHLAIGKNDVG